MQFQNRASGYCYEKSESIEILTNTSKHPIIKEKQRSKLTQRAESASSKLRIEKLTKP